MGDFQNKKVVIIGGTGGLGSAYVKMFLAEGAWVYIGARHMEKAVHQYSECEQLKIGYVNIASYKSVHQFANEVERDWGKVDYVVNATGYDVRKSLEEHSAQEIQTCVDINLKGSIHLTKCFLGMMREEKGSTIIHMGGFVDGSIAFPYYSVDVATRAGLFSFIEAMNRELKQEKSKVRITYFCPDPADTQAERPYHPIWKEMHTKIRTPEEVATYLKGIILKGKNVGYMGAYSR